MIGIEPWAYLRDVLCLLPDWPVHTLLDLAPVNRLPLGVLGERRGG